MSGGQGGEKTEAPTAKRLREAQREGERPDAREVGVAIVTLVGGLWLLIGGGSLIMGLANALRTGLALAGASSSEFAPAQAVQRLLLDLAAPMAGILGVTFAAAIGAAALMGGARFTPNKIMPKFERMNPVAGLGRMLGTHGLVETAKSIAKVAVCAVVAILALRSFQDDALALAHTDPMAAIVVLGDLVTRLFMLLAAGLCIIAVIDAPISIHRFTSRLRMTKQQVKDELKEQEGHPELKGAIRRRQREAARRGLSAAVATADVVITNPVHFAVALRYRRDADRVPIVVARAKGERALMVRAAAREHAIPTLDYPELARALYFTSRPEAEISPELYAAVATILAFVFSIGKPGLRPRAPMVVVPDKVKFDEHGRRNR